MEEGGFAGAVAADETDDAARWNLEIEAVECGVARLGFGELSRDER